MGRLGRPTPDVVLTPAQRETLERWARRPKSAQALALRCRIVLACAQGRTNGEIAAELSLNRATVGKWRRRFAALRLDGLLDEPRPGRPRGITDEDVERVITKTLEEAPKDATHWSTRSMARSTGMSQTAVCRIWQAFGLKPHLSEGFKLSPDPQFIDKVRDIVGLYLNPPDAAVVLCVDEKSQIQALDRTAPILPLLPGVPSPATHDYRRFGVTNLYADPRFVFHFTPTYSSWMNLVERWFGELTTKWLKRGTHRSVKELTASIRTWIAHWNDNPRPYVWHKTADQILEGLASYCQRINNAGHC